MSALDVAMKGLGASMQQLHVSMQHLSASMQGFDLVMQGLSGSDWATRPDHSESLVVRTGDLAVPTGVLPVDASRVCEISALTCAASGGETGVGPITLPADVGTSYDVVAPVAPLPQGAGGGSGLPPRPPTTMAFPEPGEPEPGDGIEGEGTPGTLPELSVSRPALEAKFKHAGDFGVSESRGAAGFDEFGKVIESFVNDSSTLRLLGTYRGNPAILNYNPSTAQVVVQETGGSFVSGWRMSPAQLRNLIERGSLGGG